MAIIALDTETYVKYDGTKRAEQTILNSQPYDPPKELTKGVYYPVLNTQHYTIGVVMEYKSGSLDISVFTTPERMRKHIQNRIQEETENKRVTCLYAHNHNYDFTSYMQLHRQQLPENIKLFRTTPTFLAIQTKTEVPTEFVSADEIKPKLTAYYLDTMSYYPMSLKALGKKIGLEKTEMPTQITQKEQLIDYCINDTKVVLLSIYKLKLLLGTLGINSGRITTAGTLAIQGWRKYAKQNRLDAELQQWQQKRGQWIPTSHYKKTINDQIIRKAYRGGRNEAWQIGKYSNACRIDINSLYPDSLTKIQIPVIDTELTIKDPKYLRELWKTEQLQKRIGAITATVQAPRIDLPYLPIRYKQQTYYLEETQLTGTWTTPELTRAEQLGYKIQEIYQATIYKISRKENPFKDYVNKLYKARQQNPEYTDVIKMLLNNLPAKFAQKRYETQTQIIQRDELPQYEQQGYQITGLSGDNYVISKKGKEEPTNYYIPIISAYTTAQARDHLYTELQRIPKKQRLYTDTDSLVYVETKDTNPEMVYDIGTKLGQWKIQNRHQPCEIRGRKHYTIGNQQIASGITRGTQIREGQPIIVTRMNSYAETTDMSKIGTISKIEFKYNEQEEQPPNKIEEEY